MNHRAFVLVSTLFALAAASVAARAAIEVVAPEKRVQRRRIKFIMNAAGDLVGAELE